MSPLFHVHGAIRVEYRVRTHTLGGDLGAIESEAQLVGGSGGLCALALAQLGARVRLSGNVLGDDSHGRFLRLQLQNAPNLETDLILNANIVTPYAILLRCDEGATQTLLSLQARALVLPPLQAQPNARVFNFSPRMTLESDVENHGYNALLDALRSVLRAWLEIARPDDSPDEVEAQLKRWVEGYDKGFGALPF